jgi:hypothetical protein
MATEIIEVFNAPTDVVEVLVAGPIGPQANINYTVVSSSQAVSNRQLIAANTLAGSFTLTLPSNPAAGDAIDIFDYSDTFDTNPLTIGRNGKNIEGEAEDLVANVEGAYFTLIFTGDSRGWQVVPRYGVAGVSTVSGTAPIVSSGGTTPTLSITAATTSAAGSMSSADKTKLDGIATGAEVNVQSNWTESNNALDSFILNKPATFTPSSHTHGNITNDGKVGAVSGLPVVTTTDGAVTTLALGTANQVLRVNSGATGVEFGAGFDAASPPQIGSTTPNSAAFTSLSANNGTLTASAPVLDLSQTWNDAAVTFTGLKVDATDTASATNSLLLQLQTGGTDRFSVNKAGRVSALSLGRDYNSQWIIFNTPFGSATQMGGVWFMQNNIAFGVNASLGGNSGALQLGSGQNMGWSSATNPHTANADLRLFRDAADTLAQHRDANPQTFRLYTTWANNGVDFERLFIKGQTLGAFQIGTEKGGTGSARDLELQTDGVTRMTIASSGGAITVGSGVQLGLTGIQVASTASLRFSGGAIGGSSDLWMLRSGSGIVRFATGSSTSSADFNRLQFGGTTSSFPALKRDTTTLQVKLADDSAFTAIAASNLVLTDNTGAETATFDAQAKLTDNRTYDLPDSSGTIALTAQLTDTQIFTAGGTWTKPAGAKMVHYIVIGGGGGGGSGRCDNAGTNRSGGGGGGAGGITVGWLNASALGATETITVGAGGAGGVARTTVANGQSGTAGGVSSIGSAIQTFASSAGGAGATTSGTGGTGASNTVRIYSVDGNTNGGVNGSSGSRAQGGAVFNSPTGGQGGSGISAANVVSASGAAANSGHVRTGALVAGGTGGASAAGGNGNSGGMNFVGTGGGGGSPNSSTGAGNAGGNGGLYGGGGGGGSAGAFSEASGAGGNGADGIVVITTYF